ncbi:MAG TPA: class I SAM-dependent methyltransferase [Dermatophilaceae bacterium]|nr:class I SAM-dependent methyltransferase [Dermatophilaceae bacterium]
MSDQLPVPHAEATWRRSAALFRAFRTEQSDPAGFYGALATDSVAQLSGFVRLAGATVLDVGGGPGYFADAFTGAGAHYLAVDADAGELAAVAAPGPGTVLGSGMELPIASAAVDLCYSSNVLEHVAKPWVMAEEMVRVTKPGGVVFLSFTLWWGPWGGHETAPWHYLGGALAAQRYSRKHGHPPKNVFGESLFEVRAGDALAWARSCPDAELVDAFPRYLPRWAHGLTVVPGLREVTLWNLALVLRRR